MGKSVNKVFLLGNVGKDPEVKSTPSGMTIASFSMATSDRSKDQQGNWQDKSQWHNIKAFGKTAEIVQQYVHKGDRLYVEGKLSTDSWDDKKTGEKKYRTEILVNELCLLGGKPEHVDPEVRAAKQNSRNDSTEISDDDIPF